LNSGEGRIAHGGGRIVGPNRLAREQVDELGRAGLDGVLDYHVSVRVDKAQMLAQPLPRSRLGNGADWEALALPLHGSAVTNNEAHGCLHRPTAQCWGGLARHEQAFVDVMVQHLACGVEVGPA
jgi:hypothetical protein